MGVWVGWFRSKRIGGGPIVELGGGPRLRSCSAQEPVDGCRVQRDALDWAYLEEWARALRVEALLAKASRCMTSTVDRVAHPPPVPEVMVDEIGREPSKPS